MNSAGDRVDYEVTWLEMGRPPAGPPPGPEWRDATIDEASRFPEWFFFSLYDAVGRDYAWDDMHEMAPGAVSDMLGHRDVMLFTMHRSGRVQGFHLLDFRQAGICDIAYFGLVGEAIGKGYGGWLLDDAIARGWRRPGMTKLTVNTCTLDHPAAMRLYAARGFRPVRREARSRILRRDLRIPPPRKETSC